MCLTHYSERALLLLPIHSPPILNDDCTHSQHAISMHTQSHTLFMVPSQNDVGMNTVL